MAASEIEIVARIPELRETGGSGGNSDERRRDERRAAKASPSAFRLTKNETAITASRKTGSR